MIDICTATAILEILASGSDPILLVAADEELQTTPTELTFDCLVDDSTPANELHIIFKGGAVDGSIKVKRGNLYSMVIDRMTFDSYARVRAHDSYACALAHDRGAMGDEP